jgi:hypothetical protein
MPSRRGPGEIVDMSQFVSKHLTDIEYIIIIYNIFLDNLLKRKAGEIKDERRFILVVS